MTTSSTDAGHLLAISDLHVAFEENRKAMDQVRPRTPSDWLIVAGDVAEIISDVSWALEVLRERFAKVIWVPGNHELWTHRRDPVTLRGVQRYQHLVELCRSLDVVTPEDPYPVWRGPEGPLTVAPLFLLYDYTFRPPGARTKEEALKQAYDSGVVCSDEYLLHPDPHPSLDAWCRERLRLTEKRLAELPEDTRTVLVNHYPLVRYPTRVLRYPEFAAWCGTEATADWHVRFRAHTVVYGHLHIPRTTWHDGVRFEEVSVGYPREWRQRGAAPKGPRRILPSTPSH